MLFTPNSAIRVIRHGFVLGSMTIAVGCTSNYTHLTHSDKIAPSAGDAVHAATVIQTVDPWPDNVLDTDVAMDGELAVKRANDYKQGETMPLSGQKTTLATAGGKSP